MVRGSTIILTLLLQRNYNAVFALANASSDYECVIVKGAPLKQNGEGSLLRWDFKMQNAFVNTLNSKGFGETGSAQ